MDKKAQLGLLKLDYDVVALAPGHLMCPSPPWCSCLQLNLDSIAVSPSTNSWIGRRHCYLAQPPNLLERKFGFYLVWSMSSFLLKALALQCQLWRMWYQWKSEKSVQTRRASIGTFLADVSLHPYVVAPIWQPLCVVVWVCLNWWWNEEKWGSAFSAFLSQPAHCPLWEGVSWRETAGAWQRSSLWVERTY